MEDVLDRVLPRLGGNGFIDQLAALSGSDFTSVMLEVARRRVAKIAAAGRLYAAGGRFGARVSCADSTAEVGDRLPECSHYRPSL